MKHIKLKVSYRGTNYHGFQLQPKHETIQGILEEVLTRNLKESISVIGSGRTDKGVHALAQVVSFKTCSKIPVAKLPRYINYDLPEDITVVDAQEVPKDFHPRYDAKSRLYRYTIINQPNPLGYYNDLAWHVPFALDVDDMREASKYLIGVHDFRSMMKKDSKENNTYREIYSIDINRCDSLIDIDVSGSSFLRNQVRIMVGTLVEVGLGKIEKNQIPTILNKKNRLKAGVTAPAEGLSLVEVRY